MDKRQQSAKSDLTAEQAAEAIKSAAKSIRDSSIKIKETARILRQSGAINELAEAVKIAAQASRDTMVEINKSAKEIVDHGAIRETVLAVEQTTVAAKETVNIIKDSFATNSARAVSKATLDSQKKEADVLIPTKS
jgi:hypothetical protein